MNGYTREGNSQATKGTSVAWPNVWIAKTPENMRSNYMLADDPETIELSAKHRRDRRSWSRGRARFGEDGAGAGGRRADRAGGAGGWRVALRGRHAPGRFVRCRSMMSWMSRADGCRERVNRRQAEASQCAICRVRVLPIGVARIKIPTVGMYARIAQTFARALGWLARSAKVFQAGCFT